MRRKKGKAAGTKRENQVAESLTKEGWAVVRSAGSLGAADLVAMRRGSRTRLIEVKATAGGPYERFVPSERAQLSYLAEIADADAELIWWPPNKLCKVIPQSEWPS